MTSRITLLICLLQFMMLSSIQAADKSRDGAMEPTKLGKLADITDRTAGTHNASNIGLFFENRGKLYPRRLSDGPSGEFPINSGKHYIYRINPMVGVAPDAATGRGSNVIQARYTQNEEFEAVGGYHNPDLARVAFSDQPNTWPASGWHRQDQDGNPVIVSSQDSYCVYDDANNTVDVLGIQVAQTGYAFGLAYAEDLLFFTYEITNNSTATYDSVYFALYVDFDIGNISGGDPEYTDDIIGYDAENNFVTTYDATHYSAEWGGATGIMGITLLETPVKDGVMPGVTDMHYNLYDNDVDDDDLQMVILSSNQSYMPANFRIEDYINTGSDGNIHMDDVGLIDPAGMDLVVTFSSGPYDLAPTDTLRFITCIVAGTNEADLYANLGVAQELYATDFETPKPPATPILQASAGDNQVTLYWTNTSELDPDPVTGALDFEGYNLYRSVDRGITWDQIDRNFYPETGPDPVPLVTFDRVNGIGEDLGIGYAFTDISVINGFEYWYSLTAFDQGDTLIYSLESPIGNTTDALNTLSVIPRSVAAAFVPGTTQNVIHTGTGVANYDLDVVPMSPAQLLDYGYELSFDYLGRNEIGSPGVGAVAVILDSSATQHDHYGVEFVGDDRFNLHNLSTGEVIREGYPLRFGIAYTLAPGMKITFEPTDTTRTPVAGDYISLNFSARLDRIHGADTLVILPSQKFEPGIELVSDDGLLLTLRPQAEIQDINPAPILNFDIDLQVFDPAALLDTAYQIVVTGSGTDLNGAAYVIVNALYEDLSVVSENDTILNGGSVSFDGITASFQFDESAPPPSGSSTTFSTIPALAPNIMDAYQFGIQDAETDLDQLGSAMDAIRVVPNPYVVGSLWEIEFGELRREPLRQIQFTHLPAECDIYIFTLAGGLIKTLEHRSGDGTETWDMRAEGGREIAAGIYLYQVRSEGFKYFNRFAVIK